MPEGPSEKDLTKARLGSLAPECNELKNVYETCFFDFFPRFLGGERFKEDPCSEQLAAYRDCLRNHLAGMGFNLKTLDEHRLSAAELAEALSAASPEKPKSSGQS
ncbi:unnamed protein product [Schistocephalus solidus]|uniref:CHCH domain-containing protein n=1 Tax=Schistocephalus solidus TaxID=70667 RepID=A0A183TE33_SCHSO|nr:unnamed protein product [Schistocephalus solidus]